MALAIDDIWVREDRQMNVTTIYGEMDESELEKKEGSLDNENENTDWVEYWLDGELVHRSVHVRLKTNVFAMGEAASFK